MFRQSAEGGIDLVDDGLDIDQTLLHIVFGISRNSNCSPCGWRSP